MRWFRITASATAAAVLLTGCATVPAGPSVMVLPGHGKPFEQFQSDDALCRQWAAQQTGPSPSEGGAQSTVAGAVIGTLIGAAAGAAIGAAGGRAGTGAAVGAGVGLLGGTAVGASNATPTYGSLQRRYDASYMQCMYAKGNQVPMRGYTARPPMAPPPPPPPPPPAPLPSYIPPPPSGAPPPPPAGVTR